MKVYPVSKREDNKKLGFLQDPDSKLDLNHFFQGQPPACGWI